MQVQERCLAGRSIKVIMLPGLAMAPSPQSPETLVAVSRMAARLQADCLPSLAEYDAINYKPLQFQLAASGGIAVVPYVTVCFSAKLPQLIRALNCLDQRLAAVPDLAMHCSSATDVMTYALKPAVGACRSGFVQFKLSGDCVDQRAKQLGTVMRKNCSAVGLHSEWLLQPFVSGIPLAEYKVLMGVGDDTMIVYSPIYKNHDSAYVYCPPGRMYNDVYGSDGVLNGDDEVQAGATWDTMKDLHVSISKFALACRAAFADSKGFECIRFFCRADIIVLLPPKADGQGVDPNRPLLLLNEMDNLWSASFLLDFNNPADDSLHSILPAGARRLDARSTRTAVQDSWILRLRQRLLSSLCCDDVFKHIKWATAIAAFKELKRKGGPTDSE